MNFVYTEDISTVTKSTNKLKLLLMCHYNSAVKSYQKDILIAISDTTLCPASRAAQGTLYFTHSRQGHLTPSRHLQEVFSHTAITT